MNWQQTKSLQIISAWIAFTKIDIIVTTFIGLPPKIQINISPPILQKFFFIPINCLKINRLFNLIISWASASTRACCQFHPAITLWLPTKLNFRFARRLQVFYPAWPCFVLKRLQLNIFDYSLEINHINPLSFTALELKGNFIIFLIWFDGFFISDICTSNSKVRRETSLHWEVSLVATRVERRRNLFNLQD